MPLTFQQKQEQFINELILDFKDSIQKLNDEIRNRSDAREGFVQSTGNMVLGATSNAGSIGSVTSTATSFIFNRAKSNKQAQRRECISGEVMTHLHDKIHDEIKKTAIQLWRIYHHFIAEDTKEEAIRVVADCTADRILNYMTKKATKESPLAFWNSENFLQGVFLGRSGRLKQSALNTTIEREAEASSWLKMFFNRHASTVEGLYTRGAFATKDVEGQWHYYSAKDPSNHFKYGLVVLPEATAKARLKQKDMMIFTPTSAELAPWQETLMADWELVHQPIETTPTLSADDLSESVGVHQKRLEEMEHFKIEVADWIEISARDHEKINRFMRENKRRENWEKLKNDSGTSDAQYHRLVTAWLNDLADTSSFSMEVIMDLLSRAALKAYQEKYPMVLSPQETLFFNQLPEVFWDLLEFIESTDEDKEFPFLFIKDSYGWNPAAGDRLKSYFQAHALLALYQSAPNQWMLPALWTTVLWEDASFAPFLGMFPSDLLHQKLFEHWCHVTHEDPNDFFRKNIELTVSRHPTPCPCDFCQGRSHFVDKERQDTFDTISLLPELPMHSTSSAEGFTPDKPFYAENLRNDLVVRKGWHWAERYLSQLFWQGALNRIEGSDDVNDMAVFSPILLIRQRKPREANIAWHREWGKILHDQKAYIDEMLRMFQLAQAGDLVDPNRLIMTFIEAKKIDTLCEKNIVDKLILSHQTLLTSDFSNVSADDFTLILKKHLNKPLLDSTYVALHDRGRMASLKLPDRSISTDSGINLSHKEMLKSNPEDDRERLEGIHTEVKALFAKRKHCNEELALLLKSQRPNHWNVGITADLRIEEIQLILNGKIELLNVRLLVIQNYLKGAGLLQKDFQLMDLETWEHENGFSFLSERHSDLSLGHGIPPLDMSDLHASHARLSEEKDEKKGCSEDLRPACSAYELLARATLFEAGFFWLGIEKRFGQDKKGFEEYKMTLLEHISKLPKIKNVLSGRVGKISTQELQAPLTEWRSQLQETQHMIVSELDDWEKREIVFRQQATFNVSGDTLRCQHLLDLLPCLKKDYLALPETERVFMEKALKAAQFEPMAFWISQAFERHRASLFGEYIHQELLYHFEETFPEYKKQPFSEQDNLCRALEKGNFNLACELVPNTSPEEKRTYHEAYKTFCDTLFTRFHETEQHWRSWSNKNRWMSESFQGNTAVFETFPDVMEGRWEFLSAKSVKKLLQYGLHPDATFRQKTLLNHAMTQLHDVYINRGFSVDERMNKLQKQIERVYYLLNSGVRASDWTVWLAQVKGYCPQPNEGSPLTAAQNNELLLWSRLLSALSLFEECSKNPQSKKDAEIKLNQFEQKLAVYWENFKEEKNSFKYRFFGSWYRKPSLEQNREKNHQKLKDCSQNIPLYFSHLYLYLNFLNDVIESTEKQFFNRSRLRTITQELLTGLENLVKDWRKLKPRAEEVALIETYRGFEPKSQILINMPMRLADCLRQEAEEKVAKDMATLTREKEVAELNLAKEKERAEQEKDRADRLAQELAELKRALANTQPESAYQHGSKP